MFLNPKALKRLNEKKQAMGFVSHPLIRKEMVEDRKYQERLADSFFKKGNTLIAAPTAIGKTIIAALIIAHVLEKNPDGKVLFLAPTRPLALQHLNTLKKVMKIPADDFALLTGETVAKKRRELWEKRILTATPQCVESDILNGNACLEKVVLVIFDEAHRAVRGYSYVFIAEQYKKKRKDALILALTASPGSSREKVQEVCDNLFIENVEIITEQDEDVAPYVQKKKTQWVRVRLPEEFAAVQSLLKAFLKDRMTILRENGLVIRNPSKRELLRTQSVLLKQSKKNYEDFQLISVLSQVIKAQHAIELLETQGPKQLLEYLSKLWREKSKSSKRMIQDERVQKAFVISEKLVQQGAVHPKMMKAVEIVKEETSIGNSVILFSHYRDTAKQLEAMLLDAGVACKRFIGQSSRKGEKGMSQKEQAEIIKKFRDKEFQVLIATSIGEEGLDIPAVDTVVFYEPVPSEIRSIQRRGRAGRHKEGKVIVLITEGTQDEAYYWSSVSKEKKMKSLLSGMSSEEVKSQKKLEEFIGDLEEEKPVIFADTRETASGIIRELLNRKVILKAKQLPVGDFLVSDRLAVERKEANDFVQSIIDGRLFSQLRELKSNFEKPLLLIEGEIFGIRNVSDKALRGALAAITVDFGIPVIQTRGVKDSADFIEFLAWREQFGEKREVRLRGEKHAMSLKEQQQFIVESLPGIGPVMAKNLLKHFGSVEKVFNATVEELEEVEGIGEKRAEEIRKVITGKYQE